MPRSRRAHPHFLASPLQDKILRDVIMEEHCAHHQKGSKRGYSQEVLNRMLALHDPVTHKADHDRVKAALPSTQAVLNRAAGMFKKGEWPHEIAAAHAREAQAAVHAAEVQRQVSAGINMPSAQAIGEECFAWMDDFVETELDTLGNGDFRFRTIERRTAELIDDRVRAWRQRLPSSTTRFNDFLAKLFNASHQFGGL